MSLREPLEAIHDALVRADDHLELVLFAKLDDSVGPESDEPGAPRRGLHALDGVVGRRVGPEQVHEHEAAVLHLQGPLELGDLLNPADGPADASVHAQDAVLDERGQREVVEERVESRPGPDAVRVAQALDALEAEAEEGVDVGGLERLRRAKGVREREREELDKEEVDAPRVAPPGQKNRPEGSLAFRFLLPFSSLYQANQSTKYPPRGCLGSGAPRRGARS